MKNILLISMIIIMFSCDLTPSNNGYKYNTGTISEMPVNLGDINSEFDDYNSTSPILGGTSPLCFSSSRNSSGDNFDIVYKSLDVVMYKSDGSFYIGETNSSSGGLGVASANANLIGALTKINSPHDELGPYLIREGNGIRPTATGWEQFQNYIFLFATNKSGNFDIQFTHNLNNSAYIDPVSVAFLNSSKDDLYPTLTKDSSNIYFCSNRDQNFDIYKTNISNSGNLLNVLTGETIRTVTKDLDLSSDYDDKCPFIFENMLVFASNRPGGYGGFDLYYSLFENGKWSTPVNFGNKINTGSDEYRPIIKPYGMEFTNNFMLFSSNRTGGKGGFDLYYVGIPKSTK